MLLNKKLIIGVIFIWSLVAIQGLEQTFAEKVPIKYEREFKSISNSNADSLKGGMVIRDQGVVNKGYILDFKEDFAMLSRDGSTCTTVTTGEKIVKPGRYFLTTKGKNNTFSITQFEILGQEWKENWQIQSEEALDEILKLALGKFKTDFSIQFNYGYFDLETINQILFNKIQSVLATYPKLTFESYIIRGVPGKNPTISIQINYPLTDIAKLKRYDKLADTYITEIIEKNISKIDEDYESEWKLFQYIVEQTEYDKIVLESKKDNKNNPMIHHLYGALINQVAVCDGYAKSMMYLLNSIGIPTELVFGEADGIAHVWNRVKIKERYYHLDATWADIEGKQLGGFYDYFNETDDYMKKTHIWEAKKNRRSQDERYTLPFIKMTLKDTTKIYNQGEWRNYINEIRKRKIKEQSIIFYGKDKWETKEIIGEICNTLQKSIEYNTISKYGTLIINYKAYE